MIREEHLPQKNLRNILIFGGKGDFSGVPAYIKKIKRLGVIDAFEAVIIIGSDYGGYDEIEDQKTIIRSFQGLERGAPLSLIRAFQYAKRTNADVVLANGFIGILLARVLCLIKRKTVKLYVIHHGLPFDPGATMLQRAIGLIFEKFFLYLGIKQTIISISIDNKLRLTRIYKNSIAAKVVYLPNSIDMDERDDLKMDFSTLDSYRGVWIGRDAKQKDPELLAKIASKLPYNYTIDVYGKFTPKRITYLKRLSANKLNFKGHGPLDLEYVFKNVKFFIQTSKYEGFSIAMLEAAKYRLPIFVSNVSGVADLQRSYSGIEVFSDCYDAASKLAQHDFDKQHGWLDYALSDRVWSSTLQKLISQ